MKLTKAQKKKMDKLNEDINFYKITISSFTKMLNYESQKKIKYRQAVEILLPIVDQDELAGLLAELNEFRRNAKLKDGEKELIL